MADASIPGSFEQMHVVVEVELDDGERIRARCDRPRGYVGTPLSDADHLGKVRDCLARGVAAADVDAIVDACRGIDALDGAGIARLMARLRGGAPRC